MLFPIFLAIAAAPAPGNPTHLVLEDTILFAESTGTDQLSSSPGQPLVFRVEGDPFSVPLIAVAPLAAGPGSGSIGGVPIGIDLATAISPFNGLFTGQTLDSTGELDWEITVPLDLVPGASFWCQAATLDLGTGGLSLSETVRLDMVPPDPTYLPLLAPGKQMGIIYSEANPATTQAMDAAWGQCLGAGVGVYELALGWSDLEASPGVIDTTLLQALLQTLDASGLQTYLSITTIDTVNLTIPSDLIDPANPTELAPGLTWDSQIMTSRFATVVDAVSGMLASNGGYFLSVGNEVDVYLGSRPLQVAPFGTFVDSARVRAHIQQPRLTVGVSMTLDGSLAAPALHGSMMAVSDNVPATYYPLNPDFSPRPPSVVATDLAAVAAMVFPAPLLLQEYGYPSGNLPIPGNGSSAELQRQFVENCFQFFESEPRLRMASMLHLGDYDPVQVQAFAVYYGVSAPLFAEYLGSLGLHEWGSAAPKPAFAQFLAGLGQL